MNFDLQTERLRIKLVSELNIDDVYKLQCLEETARYNTSGIPENRDQTVQMVEHWMTENAKEKSKKLTFVIEIKESNTFIGIIGINFGKEHYKNAEVWFQYNYTFWNKGYATESLRKIIDFGFQDLKLHRIEAGCAIENIGSIRVLEKVGMIREAHTRKLLPLKSGWSDNYGYAILATDERK